MFLVFLAGRRWDSFLYQLHKGLLATCLEYNSRDLNFLFLNMVCSFACSAPEWSSLSLLPFHRNTGIWALGANGKVQGCLWVQHKALLSVYLQGKNIGLSSLHWAAFPLRDSFKISPPTQKHPAQRALQTPQKHRSKQATRTANEQRQN